MEYSTQLEKKQTVSNDSWFDPSNRWSSRTLWVKEMQSKLRLLTALAKPSRKVLESFKHIRKMQIKPTKKMYSLLPNVIHNVCAHI